MTVADIRNELAREIALRRTVFPRLITAGRLTPGESVERIERLEGALTLVDVLLAHDMVHLDELPLRLVPVAGLNTQEVRT